MLFDVLNIRDVSFGNRVMVSPMCQYSSEDGFASDWHLVHLGSRAVGGAAAVFCEASAVTPEGRISPQDLGIWKDEHVEFLSRITHFIAQQGAIPGMQIAHAGRKASTRRPWEAPGSIPESEGGWLPVAPSPLPFGPGYTTPAPLEVGEIHAIARAFASAARRAFAAGFLALEIHSAHGYLLHEFLSPLSNHRGDDYGGTFENRTRLLREVVSAVRGEWPENLPLFVRISATDWIEQGWDLDQSIELARQLVPLGVDLLDCSSGGILPGARIPAGPGYQVGFADAIRKQSGIMTAAVGMINSPTQAENILRAGQADMVVMAREFLRQPYWPLTVARELGWPAAWPVQYLRAAPDGTPQREPVNILQINRRLAQAHAASDKA
jgi:2,4-dienoyl-CoA reductase-like NADH-dependent reductase (Old Yellow Enzyme family)